MIFIIPYLILGFLVNILRRIGYDEPFPILVWLIMIFLWPIGLLVDLGIALWDTEI